MTTETTATLTRGPQPTSSSPWSNPKPGTSSQSNEEVLRMQAERQSSQPAMMKPLLIAENVELVPERFRVLNFGTFGKANKASKYNQLQDEDDCVEMEAETKF